jgi:Uma2 family endonuclease
MTAKPPMPRVAKEPLNPPAQLLEPPATPVAEPNAKRPTGPVLADAPGAQRAMQPGIAYATLSPQELAARWHSALDEPSDRYHCEIDAYGEVLEIPPPKPAHQRIVAAMMRQIEAHLGGEALPGIGVLTSIGVRVPDVCWSHRIIVEELEPPAPEICVEVQSESNTLRELDEKVTAYLAAGAREVILVEISGRIRYFDVGGERADSAFALALHLPAGTYPRA